jgi:hypothetical protein
VPHISLVVREMWDTASLDAQLCRLSSRPEESWACGPPKVIKNASVRHPLSMEPLPFPCHPDRSEPGFPATLCQTRPRVRLSLKERRMRSANAIKIHRKSGEAERRDLRFRGPFLEMFFDKA